MLHGLGWLFLDFGNLCLCLYIWLLRMSAQQGLARKKLDKLIVESITQVGKSTVLGALTSLVFFKRKGWPVIVGIGFGIGASFAELSRELNSD